MAVWRRWPILIIIVVDCYAMRRLTALTWGEIYVSSEEGGSQALDSLEHSGEYHGG